ncbi:hypothetical protein WJ0W_000660 [Paenibacillus melissococcoides]|uniref:Transposase DDE domain-containing protein n=2 Tax=Paenibacillus melissococcoides TaxID=2912268 RepID=A0ABN8TXM0_9BACL|nr:MULTISPECIES: hypothetical protein [Paenibacillus]MEB9895399.1 hypothetical protein [Bacillus cereus]CAH8243420.1 hypothetical protein WJ0W_000660 [Paenibacillus melissococcoides]CAH8704461.1 hypothetical protein WDD9_000649 [Paenibacillus melissococcoides]CAH8707730.1 hypothetical protein HTL2_001734 [Paenibacillus melissococcoides]
MTAKSSKMFSKRLLIWFRLHKRLLADADYKMPAIYKTLQEREIRPVLPYVRPQTKEGFFKKHESVYNEHYDC